MTKVANILVDMSNIDNQSSPNIIVENSSEKFISFSKTNNSTGNIDYNGKFVFDGTNGLIVKNPGYIDLSLPKWYIEFDFLVTADVGDSAHLQTLFSLFPEIEITNNDICVASYISVQYGFLALWQYNTNAGLFASHHITHKFELNKKYNIKFIKNSNTQLLIFLDNILKYKTNTYTTSNTQDSGGSISNNYSNKFLRLGQQRSSVLTHNLKGEIYNFKVINYIGDINKSFEYNSESLIHHFLLEEYNNFNNNNNYKYKPIIDLGLNPQNATVSSMNISHNPFIDLNDGGLFWYKPKASTITFSLNRNPLQLNDNCTISFKMKTNSTLEDCSLIDCRNATGSYNGLLITLPAADPTSMRLYISDKSSTTAWSSNAGTDTGIISPNTEYLIKILKTKTYIKILVNGSELIVSDISNMNISWISNTISFFNNIAGSSASNHYFKDLRIYNDIILDDPIIDTNKLINLSINNWTHINNETLKYDVTSFKTNTTFTSYFNGNTFDNEYDVSKYNPTIESEQLVDYYLFVEGHPEYTFNLYKNNSLILDNINNKKIEIADQKKYLYHYIINETGIKKSLKKMILAKLTVNLSNIKCEGSDFYARLYNNETGEFIGDYNLINNSVTILNLDYNTSYDVVLIDRNKVFENRIKSKLKPVYADVIEQRDSIVDIRELSYYEACLKYTVPLVNTKLAENPNSTFISIAAHNTDTIISKLKLLKANAQLNYIEIGSVDNKEIIRVKSVIKINDNEIYISGNISDILANSIIEINNEILYVISKFNDKLTVKRGFLDTFPSNHVGDSFVNILSNNFYINDIFTEKSINIKAVDNIVGNIAQVKSNDLYIRNRLNAPLPPANIKINGVYNLTETDTTNKLILTWDHRNYNVLKDYYDNTTVTDLDDNIVYRLTVYKIDKNNKETLFLKENIGTVTTYTINLSTDITIFKYRIILSSIKNGTIESYYNYDHTINAYFTSPFNITVTTI